jgi:RNA polymerase sigma-70 factor (ECF subfamily)
MAATGEFVGFYEREAKSVLVFFARRTLDGELALDLTAETFAQAWCGWARVRSESPEEVRGWLFTIARRQLSGYLRRGRVERRALRQLGVSTPAMQHDDLFEIDDAAGLGELRVALKVELASLGADQREALQLRVVEELPYTVVAQRLGISEATARARVSRGLRALSRALDPVVSAGGTAR